MVAMNGQAILHYDDGAGWPNYSREKEQAFRQGFVEEARRVVREWVDPEDDTFDPWAEVATAERTRRRVRDRLGCQPGHEVPAARARGRHHALAFVTQAWDEVGDLDAFDRLVMPAWLMAVERWARKPIRMNVISPPPRPMEIEGTEAVGHTGVQHQCGDESADAEAAPPPPAHRLKLTRADQIEMRPPVWLLRGMLERDTFALVFGDPGTGKSFLAIDWACRVATGTPWRGHGVTAGPVVYVAGEGQQGFGRRIRAWSEHQGVSLAGAPLFVAPAVAIPEMPQLGELAVAIDETLAPPALIVLDTLARCFGGGDENSTQDMSRFVSACDALRRRYGCTILVVHHTGHADKSRARGAIALKAALDAEYRLADNEAGLTLTATKMKDAETPPPLGLELVSVDLPGLVDDYGNPVTSAAIEVIDADTGAIESQVKAARPRGKWQEVGLAVARRLIATSDDGQASVKVWHAECDAMGMRQSTRYDVLSKLHDQGAVIVDGDALIPT
ncbi:MAG: helicase RepA family protein [Phycisphaeraceae bacterium]